MSALDDTATETGPDLPRWGRYILRSRVGEGAQGAVYCAWDPQLECDVALKVVGLEQVHDAVSDSMLREARALARVRHTHVVNVYGVEAHEGKIGICMELIKGRTLEEMLQSQGRFGPHEAVTVGLAVGRALAAVHAAGLVHRDIKARNVMRENTGRIVLMDFGMGRDHAQLQAWGAGDLAGTPLYMAPEVCAGAAASQKSDVYSVGVLLYHLVTGAYPVEGKSFAEIAGAHRQGRRTPLVERRPDLPEGFIGVVDRALAPNPDDRYASAAQLVHDLVAIERREFEPAAEPRTIAQRLVSWATAIAATAVAVTVTGFVSSSTFNVMLERSDFAGESVLDWTVWGLRSLIAPVFNVAQVLITVFLLVTLWRVVRRFVPPADRWWKHVRAAAARARVDLGLTTPDSLAHLALALGTLYLVLIIYRYWDLIWAVAEFSSTPEQLSLLRPENRFARFRYYRDTLDWLVLGTGWAVYRFVRIRRAHPDRIGAAPLMGLVATFLLAFILWASPYRVFYQSERPRLDVGGERCYDLGRSASEVLIFCPMGDEPKVRRVSAGDKRVRDTGVTESVFAAP